MKNRHIMGGKTEKADSSWSQQKTPCKKNSREKKAKKNWSLLLLNLFREGAHMGKIRLFKKDRDRKNRKKC